LSFIQSIDKLSIIYYLKKKIFSGGVADYALWTPGLQNIEKKKPKDKIICCQWSSDGMHLAYGTIAGTVVLLSRNLEEEG